MRCLNPCPIDGIIPELIDTVRGNPAIVLQAPPGAGKTTRVPLALLDIIPPEKGRIIMLQPRRIAAVSAARWMARALGEEAGGTVGYSIRFESRVSKMTRIEVITEAILIRRMQNDPALEGAGVVIFDEFHERSLYSDLALALCFDLCRGLREDLKIIVMSATLDCGPISSLLGGAPVISCGGIAFPVEERYLVEGRDRHVPERITEAAVLALKETSGDILAFLPGSGEIRASASALQEIVGSRKEAIEIHPLYGDLPFEKQERAILPSHRRKIVLATNIAETSLTIEGVRVVIDSGLTRRLRYAPATGMNRLVTGMVSKASAEQRKGRAGRLAPGVCYRLYSRHVLQSMIPFPPPEILASDLSGLVLELAVWGVRSSESLSWLDAPPPAAWEAALRLLTELGALDHSGLVTSAGREMCRMPLHPRLARMVHRAAELACPGLGSDLAAILSERDILRYRPGNRALFPNEPDITDRLEALQAWRSRQVIPAAADEGALRTVDKTSKQIMSLNESRKTAERHFDHDMVSRLLLGAFPDRIARRRQEGGGRFVLAAGRGVRLSPTSRLARSQFIVAVNVDAGEKAEGAVHVASSLSLDLIREEYGRRIETFRRVEWDKREGRIVASTEERIGAVNLSSRPLSPDDEETSAVLCEVIRQTPGILDFSGEAEQFRGRTMLISRVFPEETWPDLSEGRLLSLPEEWLLPWLHGVKCRHDLVRLDVLPAMKALLSREQMRLLDERAPVAVRVPSGHRVPIDYTAGEVPALAVKVQEMFGLADTPEIAGGRVKVLLHLLSPSRRPVQVTRDLRTFWNSGYHQVRKELRGRYPKHPWPDDPWNAVPTRRAKPRSR